MAVVLSGGQVVSTASGPWSTPLEYSGPGGNGAHPLFEYFRSSSYEQLYICQPSVRKVIDKRASLQGIVPFKAYSKSGDDSRTSARSTAFGRLTASPSSEMSQRAWRRWHRVIEDIHGITFGALVRDGNGQVQEVLPLHPMRMRFGESQDKGPMDTSMLTAKERISGLTYWFVVDQETEVHFPRRNLFIDRFMHPSQDHWGLSKLESLRSTLEDDAAARAAMEAMWKRGARPHYVIQTQDNMSNHPAIVQQIKDDAEASHGGVGNWWRPLVLDGGADIKELRFEKGLEYLGLRKLTDVEVGAVYDLSGAIIHNHERSTFNNIQEIHQDVFRSTMADVLGSFESSWNHDVRDGTHGEDVAPNFPEGLYAEHDTSGVLRGSPEKVIQAGSVQLQTGQLTINEFRKLNNRPPVEGGDILLVNAALVPLSNFTADLDENPEQLAKMAQQLYLATPEKAVLTTAEAREILNRRGASLGANSVDLAPPAVGSQAAIPATTGLSGREAAAAVLGRLGRLEQVADVDLVRLTGDLSGGAAETVRAAVMSSLVADESVGDLRDLIRKLDL